MTIAQIAAIIQLLLAFNVPQPTVNTVQAILMNANTPAQSISLPSADVPIGTSAPVIVTPMPIPFVLYKLVYEDGQQDFYYAGNKELAGMTVNGEDGVVKTAKYLPNDCYSLPSGEKVCGYWMARFNATKGETNAIMLTAKDGTTYSGSL